MLPEVISGGFGGRGRSIRKTSVRSLLRSRLVFSYRRAPPERNIAAKTPPHHADDEEAGAAGDEDAATWSHNAL